MRNLSLALAVCVGAWMATAQPGAAERPMKDGERFTAVAVSPGGPGLQPGAGQFDITIDRWSTDQERTRLMEAVKKDDQNAVLNVLRELKPVGRILPPGAIGYDLRYAHQVPTDDGGRRIFIATDRPIGFWEAQARPRTIDYPFTFIELRMDKAGTGEGKLSIATRIIASPDGRVIQLEDWAAQPVQLTKVTRHDG